ncbi:MAG: hypothetical protein AAGB12_16465 [Pseudomonadota bacterium]
MCNNFYQDMDTGAQVHSSRRFAQFSFDNYSNKNYYCDSVSVNAVYEDFYGSYIGFRRIRVEDIVIPANSFSIDFQVGLELTQALENTYDNPQIATLDSNSLIADCKPQAPEPVDYFTVDDWCVSLRTTDKSDVSFSQNIGDDSSEDIEWNNPDGLMTRFEYRIDYGTSGKSAGNNDLGWNHAKTYDAGISKSSLYFRQGSIKPSNVPFYSAFSTSPYFNPNDYAKLHFRLRFEDPITENFSEWRYFTVWIHYAD